MKKMFILIFMLIGINFFVFSQTKNEKITVVGFVGDKSLYKDQIVFVNYPERGMQMIAEEAYKGETQKSFLERIKKRSLYQPRWQSHSSTNARLSKDSLLFKKKSQIQSVDEKNRKKMK